MFQSLLFLSNFTNLSHGDDIKSEVGEEEDDREGMGMGMERFAVIAPERKN